MKIRFLLIGTSLSLIPQTINAQCVATQDCATLGYTETSCSGGSGVKCPFGNKWACFKSEAEICVDLGFTLPCTESNQTGGLGKVCNGKYSECTCSSGYIWNVSSQKCEDATANCTIGALYYSDGSCSQVAIVDKNLLGVVVLEKTSNSNGWIMSINPVQTDAYWSTEQKDIPNLSNYAATPTDTQSSCSNTNTITAYGDSSIYPAAWIAKNYKPYGTPNGKSWCLPSGGLLNSINNADNFAKINTSIDKVGGKKLGFGTNYVGEYIWSSTEYSSSMVWFFQAQTSGTFSMSRRTKDSSSSHDFYTVRPVMAF